MTLILVNPTAVTDLRHISGLPSIDFDGDDGDELNYRP